MTITPEQIDEVAEENRWFCPVFDQPPFTLILQYLAGDLSLEGTVDQLTAPINSSYSTADFGNAIRAAERSAAHQRKFFSSEDEAREKWGDPLPESEVPPAVPDGTPSTAGQLGQLWYAILHAAKRTSWQKDVDAHAKLVALVAALKRVPDPPMPVNATKALRMEWAWSTGTLWSTLMMMGAARREMWNDSPGGQFSYSPATIAAWTNINAFIARLSAEDVQQYALPALSTICRALEVTRDVKEGNWLDATVPAAAAWISIWGKEMYARREDFPPTDRNYGRRWSLERWASWKQRFEEIVGEEVSDETKAIAKAAFERMEEIERA